MESSEEEMGKTRAEEDLHDWNTPSQVIVAAP
jgi:hypothetical protein